MATGFMKCQNQWLFIGKTSDSDIQIPLLPPTRLYTVLTSNRISEQGTTLMFSVISPEHSGVMPFDPSIKTYIRGIGVGKSNNSVFVLTDGTYIYSQIIVICI